MPQRQHSWEHADGPERTCAALADALSLFSGALLEHHVHIYTSVDMCKNVNIDMLCLHAPILEALL
eukprot:3346281-Lingulodinium_polyedra.AAC.1